MKLFEYKEFDYYRELTIFGVKIRTFRNKYFAQLRELHNILQKMDRTCEETILEKSIFHTYVPAIEGDFKQYVLANNMPERISVLKSGLDELSIAHLDYLLNAMLDFPTQFKAHLFSNHSLMFYYPEWLRNEATSVRYFTNLKWRDGAIGGHESLYYKHGLNLVPAKVIEYMAGKTFLDVGSFNGDSTLAFVDFKPAKILAFDISRINVDKYRSRIDELSSAIEIESFHLCLSDKKSSMMVNDMGTHSDSLFISAVRGTPVTLETMDEFLATRNDVIGLIKADIEGGEMAMLRGGESTIRRYRPVISICIYHNPNQFFEAKPMIESWGLNYKFMLRMLAFYEESALGEATLIAYPAELE
jgi:FkbM family methyltransferase